MYLPFPYGPLPLVEKKTRFIVKGKVISIPLAVIGGVEIILLMIAFGILLYVGGRKLLLEAKLLLQSLPAILEGVDHWLMDNCSFAERFF